MRASKLAKLLKPYIMSWIQEGSTTVSGGGSGGLTTHALNGPYHSGTLDDAQAPQFLKTDGSRALTGDLSVASGVTIDGVDISDHAGNANAHHAAFVGLKDQYGANVDPDAGNRVTVEGATGGGVTATASTNKIDLAVDSTVVRTARTITAGAGLTGGGDLSANRTIDVGAGTGITVNADNVAVNQAYNFNWTGTHSWGTAGVTIYSTGNVSLGPDVYLPYSGLIAVTETLHINIDSDNTSTGAAFIIRHDGDTSAAAEIFRVNESGNVTAVGNVSAVDGTFSGVVTVAQDFTVGANVLFVDQSQANVGINRAPDAQFALDVSGPARADWFVGPHAIQLENARDIFHLDTSIGGSADNGSIMSHAGYTLTPHNGSWATLKWGKFQGSVAPGSGAANVLPNPDFATGISGWSTTDTLTAVASPDAIASNQYMRVEYASGTAVSVYRDITTTATGGWSGLAFVRAGNEITEGVDAQIIVYSYENGAWQNTSKIYTLTSEWQPIWVTHTAGSGTTTVRIRISALTTAAGAQLDIGGCSLVNASCPRFWPWTSTNSVNSLKYDVSRLNNREGGIFLYAYILPRGEGGPQLDDTNRYVLGHSDTTTQPYKNRLSIGYQAWNNKWHWDITDSAGNGVTFASAPEITTTGWHQFGITWKQLSTGDYQVEAYLDGVQQASVTTALFPNFQNPTSVGQWLHFGSWANNQLQCLTVLDEIVVLDRFIDSDHVRSVYESNAPVFAESSVFAWRSPSASPVWVDEEGLWVQDTAGTQIFGVYAGDSTKTWGGLSMTAGDVLIGNSTDGYVYFDASGAGTTKLTIEAANFKVSDSGVSIQATSGFNDLNSYLFVDSSGNTVGRLAARDVTTAPKSRTIQLECDTSSDPSYSPFAYLYAKSSESSTATTAIFSENASATSATYYPAYIAVRSNTLASGDSAFPRVVDVLSSVINLNTDAVKIATFGSTPTSSELYGTNDANIYIRNGKFIIQYKDGGTIRYKYLTLSGTGTTWTHTTTAP